MSEIKSIAAHAALQSFWNCYLRESGDSGEWLSAEQGAAILGEAAASVADSPGGFRLDRLARQGVDVCLPVVYRSAVGRHLFAAPALYRAGEAGPWLVADYLTLTLLAVKELSLQHNSSASADELVLRLIQSKQLIERFVEGRQDDTDALYGADSTFLDAEQSLLFGHLIHPTPKSRQGIPDTKQEAYSPELKGAFQLHYFYAHPSLVAEDSALPDSAGALIKRALRGEAGVSPAFAEQYCREDDTAGVLVPAHPLQAEYVLSLPYVQAWISEGLLTHLGPQGEPYAATSSLRTVYRTEAPFMFKFSLNVKVTNSLRVNKFKELERGVEVSRLLETGIGEVRRQYPGFDIVTDPAYVSLKPPAGAEESGFETVLRSNVFAGEDGINATLVAGLVQDALPGHPTRLGRIVSDLAVREGRTTAEVSLDWFRRYLDISLKPMVWLYLTFGIALEAHQQNSVVRLRDGYPERFYYRDNQGYYFCESTKELLERELPGIGLKSQTVCADAVADERFRYYLIFNHMFGLINGFGAAGLIEEQALLAELRDALASFRPMDRAPSVFLETLLTSEMLPCKANLLTRLFDMDELVGALDTQSVYVDIDNPLVKEAAGSDSTRTAVEFAGR